MNYHVTYTAGFCSCALSCIAHYSSKQCLNGTPSVVHIVPKMAGLISERQKSRYNTFLVFDIQISSCIMCYLIVMFSSLLFFREVKITWYGVIW
jgi:hypothetical protein